MSFSTWKLTDTLPVFRNRIFEDILLGNYGKISKAWLVPGHLLVSCDSGSKLSALDCIPASRHQDMTTQGSGFKNLSPPVLDIIFPEIYDDVMFVIQENGHVQCWQFSVTYTWDCLIEFDICNTTGTQVVSVCVHQTDRLLYWCERRTSSLHTEPHYCVCKRTLPEDVSNLKKKDIGPVVAMVHNCPACDVFPFGNSVFIASRHLGDGVHISLIINPDTDHMTLYVGDSGIEVNRSLSSHSVDFRAMLLQSLSAVTKSNQLTGAIGVKYDQVSQTVCVMYKDGNVRLYHSNTNRRTDIEKTSGTLPQPLGESVNSHWFVSKDMVGVVRGNTVRLFDVIKGCCLSEVTSPDDLDIDGIIVSMTSTFTAGFYTKTNFYLIQRDAPKELYSDFGSICNRHRYQTDALHIAYLSQMRNAEQSLETRKKLEELYMVWKNRQARQPKTALSQLVDPYVCEFWRLEEMFGRIFNDGKITHAGEDSSLRLEILDCVSLDRSQSVTAQESRLLWLSEKSPREVLQVLSEGLHFDAAGDVAPEDTPRWLTVLGLDSDGMIQGGSNVLIFEHICRLLFKLEPSRLVDFVRCAQQVSEQTIGVSAFIRKKHTSQYYKRAVSCLPTPSRSCDPSTASQVKAQLILACGGDHDSVRAVKLLLSYHQWQAAIDLVRRQEEKSALRACLLYITLSHLAQNQALAQFAEDIFKMIPTWQSFLTLSDVISSQPDMRQIQLSNSASAITYQGPPDIPLAAVHPLVLKLTAAHQ